MKGLLLSAAQITLLAALFACPALAQDTPTLDPSGVSEVISIGQRIGQTYTDVLTSPVSVITLDEIEASGAAYIADLLRTIPGMAVNRGGPAGSNTQVRMRGTEGNHILVLIDGVKASNPNTGEFNFAFLRAEDVLKIEVLRGEQSALWGSDAIGGVINIITRAESTREHYRITVEGGSFGTGEAQFSAVIPLGTAALSVTGNVFKTAGYDVSGSGGEEDGADSRALNVGLNKVDLAGLTLSGKFSTQVANNDFDGFNFFTGGLSDALSETETKTKTGQLSARFTLAGFENLVNASLTDVEQTTRGTTFDSRNTGHRTQFNWAAEKSWDVHSLTILAETEKEDFSNFGGVGAGQNQNEGIKNHAIAADYRFNQNAVTLTASARQGFNDRFDDVFTWRVGAGYAFEDFGGRVRASVGTGVKNPSMTELFGFFPNNFTGNPDLKPETSVGYDIGYEHVWGDIKFSVDYFHSDLEDEIYFISGLDPITFARLRPDTMGNLTAKSSREGVELEMRGDISGNLSVRASTTILDAKEDNGKEIRRPDFLASASTTWNPFDPLSMTLSVQHIGRQLDTGARELDAFTLVGLNIRYSLNDIVTLSVRGENLLDQDYQEVVGYASQGRGVYAGLSADF